MSCGTQVGAKEWFLRSNKGIIALRQAEYQMPWPTDHKPMRTRWVTFHEQKWVRSRERRGLPPSQPDRATMGVDAQAHHPQQMLRAVRRLQRCDADVPARGGAKKLGRLLRHRIRQLPYHLAQGFSDSGVNRVSFHQHRWHRRSERSPPYQSVGKMISGQDTCRTKHAPSTV